MRGWVRVVAMLCLLVTAGPIGAWSQQTELRDRYLGRPRGPYRGQVIDAETKAPLAGAVVMALWRQNRSIPFTRCLRTTRYVRRLPDRKDDSSWMLRTLRRVTESHAPEFLIFIPQYGSFPSNYVAPPGYIGGIFERPGAVVELPRLESRDARRRNLRALDPYGYSETPFRDLPELMRRLNAESISVGLDPYTPGKD